MATQWKYRKDGQDFGPVTSGQLKQMAASGQLAPDDLIWKEGLTDWPSGSSRRTNYRMP